MAVQYKDYYQVLGVAKNASQDEIRKAFRKLAREFHPDVAKDKKAAEGKFKEINEANEVLGDPEKRKKYDELGANWNQGGFQPPPGGQWGAGNGFGGDGFSDFFEAFFGGASRGGGFGRGGVGGMPRSPFGGAESPQKQDIDAEVQVSLEDVLEGGTKRVSFRRSKGATPETLEVKIPKGICEGQKIRLAGKGRHGGDLLLKVSIAPHSQYHVEGEDLVSDVEVPAWKAVLGGDVAVGTPDGTVRLKITPGTQSGRRFRIKERGLPKRNKERGDFYAQIKVAVPTELTAEQKKLWEALAELEGR